MNSIVPAEVETFHSQHFQGDEELLSRVTEVFLRRPGAGAVAAVLTAFSSGGWLCSSMCLQQPQHWEEIVRPW